jgi:Zn finger protein HypA/HybF involved in hydrogenase expression
MSAAKWELADIFRRLDPAFLAALPLAQQRVIKDLLACRTVALGGQLWQCQQCQHQQLVYHSCRNRHCPKCQAQARAAWLTQQTQHLLPVEYYHLVFTLPDELAPLALQHKRLLYGLLFRAASATLRELAADPKHLGAEIGCLAVLHTWGQQLQLHPHLHCIVTGGGLAPDRRGFFLPVKVLSRLFRRKYLAGLQAAASQGKLGSQAQSLAPLLARLQAKEWVVYAKPPFGGPTQVLKYLARYTHRVALANQRLQAVDEAGVTFRWKDYAAGNETKSLTLPVAEFVRRFLLHVLPTGFVRIRHYGLLANHGRQTKLTRCRQLLANVRRGNGAADPATAPIAQEAAVTRQERCPHCQSGRMKVIARLVASPVGTVTRVGISFSVDTS